MCCCLLVFFLSPVKIAFFTTILSILVSISAYPIRISVFPPSAVVISFSSGIIILFCYCAIITTHERKNSKNNIMILITTTIVLFSTKRETTHSPTSTKIITTLASPFIWIAIAIIILAIVCINKSMYSPIKTLVQTY
jgi:hypothetical protein